VSLDRRLRDELRRDASRIDPDIDRNLGAVEGRARRRSPIGGVSLAAAAAVIALVVGVRLGLPPPQSGATQTPGSSRGPSALIAAATPASTFDAIAGTYVVTLDSADPAVGSSGIAGTWTMRLIADGELFLSPPPGFGSGTSSLSGLAFNLAADRFRSNIFYNDYCNSIGTYTWALEAGQLSFAPVDDTCPIRRALLSTTPWHVGP
jgi:hypothetical protein